MRQKSGPRKAASEKVVKDIRRATRKRHSAEERIRIVLDGLCVVRTASPSCAVVKGSRRAAQKLSQSVICKGAVIEILESWLTFETEQDSAISPM